MAVTVLLWAGLPPSETPGRRGFNNFPEHLFAQVERVDIYLSIEQRKTPTTMTTMTGSPKQVEWATTILAAKTQALEEFVQYAADRVQRGNMPQMWADVCAEVGNAMKADMDSWSAAKIIDYRSLDITARAQKFAEAVYTKRQGA